MGFTIEQQKAIALARARKRKAESEGAAAQLPGVEQEQGGRYEPPLTKGGMTVNQGQMDDFVDGAAEFSAAVNRGVTGLVDMLGPDLFNNVSSLLGSEMRAPTIRENMPGIEGNFMDEGYARDAVRVTGEYAVPIAAGGKAVAARDLTRPGGAMAEFMGFGSAKPVGMTGVAAIDNAPRIDPEKTKLLPAVPEGVAPKNPKVARDLALKGQRGDVSSFGYKLDDYGREVKDAAQASAAKVGYPKKIVTMVAQSTPQTKKRMVKMLDMLEATMENATNPNRLTNVTGESLIDRFKIINARRKLAGKEIDAAAEKLRGKNVDFQPAVDGFVEEMQSIGIQFSDDMTPDFIGSNIQGYKHSEGLLARVVDRMRDIGKNPDAEAVHRLKRFIDTQVNIGKVSKDGLASEVEIPLKRLRHNLDSILDGQFPEYDKANTVYSETVGALNALRDAGAKRINFDSESASSALGQLSRRLLGNTQSRAALEDAVRGLDEVAKKYAPKGYDLGDTVVEQLKFIDELERQFGSDAVVEMGFQNEVAKGAMSAMSGGKSDALGAGVNYIKKAFEPSDKQKIEAMRRLLSGSATN